MKIKVCGMRQANNLAALGQLQVDMVGFIFYPPSPRFVEQVPVIQLPSSIERVGVFVNAAIAEIEEKAQLFELNYIQLHGEESPAFCQEVKDKGYNMIKAFAVGAGFDFEVLKAYEGACNLFLLDTKGASYGGNGQTFDWSMLEQYPSPTPFLLSGGIALEHAAALKALAIPQLYGIDINSRFEEQPALKNIPMIHQFLQQLSSI